MKKFFYVNFPPELFPSIREQDGFICLTGKAGNKDAWNADSDGIVVWQDIDLARDLAARNKKTGRVSVAMPINMAHAPDNIEYAQYALNENILANVPQGERKKAVSLQKRIARLGQLVGLFEETRNWLCKNFSLKTDKILLLLDGDEKEEEKSELIARAKSENPGRKLLIRTLDSPEIKASFAKSSKLFPWQEIYEYEKAYSVKSLPVLYLAVFCSQVHLGREIFDRENFIAGMMPERQSRLLVQFYFHICRNSFLDNMDGLLVDFMDPFSRKTIEARARSDKSRDRLQKLEEFVKKHPRLPLKNLGRYARKRICRRTFKQLEQILPARQERDGLFQNLRKRGGVSKGRHASPASGMPDSHALQKMRALFQNGKMEQATAIGLEFWANGKTSPQLLRNFVNLCFSLGHFHSGLAICRVGENQYSCWNNCEFEFFALRFLLLLNQKQEGIAQLAKFAMGYNQGNLNLSRFRIDHKLKTLFGEHDWERVFSLLKLGRCKKPSMQRARLLYNMKRYESAQEILKDLKDPQASMLLFQYYLDSNQFDQARELLDAKINLPRFNPEKTLIFHTATGNAAETRALLSNREWREEIKNFPALYMALSLVGDLWPAYRTFSKASHFHLLDRHFPHTFLPTLRSDMSQVPRAVVFSECFIGDELRYSRMYPEIARQIRATECIFTCDRRLEGIFRRTFPELSFHGLEKKRELDIVEDLENYRALPGMECARYMDNGSWRRFRDFERVLTVVGALSGVMKGYELLENLPALRCDPLLAEKFARTLLEIRKRTGKRYIAGLSWRSNLSDVKRDTFVLSRELLAELLALPDICWLSCQYDGLKPEEEEFFAQFDNFIQLPDVDQFDDVESAAALYASLDLLLSAPTYTADLGAAVGTPTLVPMPTPGYSVYCRPGSPVAVFDSSYEYIYYKHAAGIKVVIQRLMEKLQNLDERKQSI